MRNLILICGLFASLGVNAGGVETKPLFEIAIDTQLTPPEIFLQLQDDLVKSQMTDVDGGVETFGFKVDFDGGVETLDNPLFESYLKQGLKVDVKKIMYTGETDDAVFALVNDLKVPVKITDEQLNQSPQIQFALKKSYETADWFKPKD
jgi:hypothetical protein